MIPLLLALGGEEVLELLGIALATAGATYLYSRYKDSDVFSSVSAGAYSVGFSNSSNEDNAFDTNSKEISYSPVVDDATQVRKPSIDAFEIQQKGADTVSQNSQSQSQKVEVKQSGQTEVSENKPITHPTQSVSSGYSSSTGGNSLLDVLEVANQIHAQGYSSIATAISSISAGGQSLDKVKVQIEGLDEFIQKFSQVWDDTNRLLKGLIFSTASISLSIEGLRRLFSTPISVNPDKPLTQGTPIEIISHSAGVQAKTFADINSFELSDDDIPDLPSGVDLSPIFKFLTVSSQLLGGG